jgi:glycosyltransferase involved in cell wall biosynthesis
VEHLGPEIDDVRVSVLLTVHNYADHVGEALHSVALSDLREIEVVVIDDASTDGSVDAIRSTCAEVPWLPVTLVRRGRNGGLPAARNLAAAHAQADMLFVLDADNAVMPAGIGRLAQALEADPDAAFAYGIIQSFGSKGPVGLMNWLDWDPWRLRYGNYIDAMSLLRRSALDEVGGYATDPALYGWEDFALWAAMGQAGLKGVLVPEIVARYRVSAHSMISLTNIDSTAAWASLLRKFPFLAQSSPPPVAV